MKGLTYREVAKHHIVCDDYQTCKRGLSKTAHTKGQFDRMGHLHWSSIDKRLTRAGLLRLLTLMETRKTEIDWGDEMPHWWKIWRAGTAATQIALDDYHIRIPKELTYKARNEAARWVIREHAKPRTENFAAYQWIYRR